MMRIGRIRARTGLTLVELVVVLAILVLVAGTTLTVTGGMVQETHYQTTDTALRDFERVLLGSYDSASSGEDDAISFVADVGRLPIVASSEGSAALSELWSPTAGVERFAIQSPAGDLDVRLPGGWRGPYVSLGVGASSLVDGWGRPYLLLGADDLVAPFGTELRKIRTLGADGAPGGSTYDGDVDRVFESTAPYVLGARHLGTVPVRVTSPIVGGHSLYVRIYGPRDGDVRTLAQIGPVAANGDDLADAFAGIPVGPRVVRAYRVASSTPPASEQAPFDATAVRSAMRAITVVQGGIPEVVIDLP